MEFIYTAVNPDGVKERGRLEANDEKEIVDYLRGKGLLPLSIKNLDKRAVNILNYFSRVKGSDVVLFTRQLASMITTGLTVIESLTILKQQDNKPQLQKVIEDMIAMLSEGAPLSRALANYPEVFSITYIALIESAETGGILDKVLARLADNLEKSEDIKKRVKSALFYPSIVVAGVIGVLILMNVVVIPQMSTLYESLNVELPLMTVVVLGISKVSTILLPFALPIVAIAAYAFHRYSKTSNGIKNIDRIKLKAPVFGEIVKLSILTEVNRTISLLVGSGASLIQTLNIASEVAGNVYYKKALQNTSSLVEKGATLTVALQNQSIFPPLMLQMAKVGESTGKLDDSLLKVSGYFERDLDLRIKTLTTAIEPLLIIFLGISVAVLIISVITPIYSLISQIQ